MIAGVKSGRRIAAERRGNSFGVIESEVDELAASKMVLTWIQTIFFLLFFPLYILNRVLFA